MNMFRTLRADEIDCRIAQIKENSVTHKKGLSLLLYKDARCDQNILDEVVGPYNWKREHTRDNRNCIVSIKNPETGEWVSKEDTGTESNTEKEKGLASDSFKRACFNWGIGRELYTAPFVWIPAKECNIKENRGRLACYDRFTVKGIGYTDGVITGLEIKNQATGKVCYKWGTVNEEAPDKPEQPDNEPPEVKPINPDAPGTVETSNKVPAPEKLDPVANFIRNEISDIQEKTGLASYADARTTVFNLAKTLVESGSVPAFEWKTITLKQAKNLFAAIRKILPDGDAA
jgi:hypothetical protein